MSPAGIELGYFAISMPVFYCALHTSRWVKTGQIVGFFSQNCKNCSISCDSLSPEQIPACIKGNRAAQFLGDFPAKRGTFSAQVA